MDVHLHLPPSNKVDCPDPQALSRLVSLYVQAVPLMRYAFDTVLLFLLQLKEV